MKVEMADGGKTVANLEQRMASIGATSTLKPSDTPGVFEGVLLPPPPDRLVHAFGGKSLGVLWKARISITMPDGEIVEFERELTATPS